MLGYIIEKYEKYMSINLATACLNFSVELAAGFLSY